jgi:hypothetical protein
MVRPNDDGNASKNDQGEPMKKIPAAVILIALIGYGFAYFWNYSVDLTRHGHALTPTTQSLLRSLPKDFAITLYSSDIDRYHTVKWLVQRYQAFAPTLAFEWKKSQYALSPEYSGDMLVISSGQQQQLINLAENVLDESRLTQALFKCIRQGSRWVVFLQGHEEGDPFGMRARDYGLFRQALENQGLKIQRLNLKEIAIIPDNTQLVIMASPKTSLLPMEEEQLLNYVRQGGDLLWLVDPNVPKIPYLSAYLGVSVIGGPILDHHGQALGTGHPAITIVEKYPALPFAPPRALSAFPFAVALLQRESTIFKATELLKTHENTKINDTPGPLLLGLGLTRVSSGDHGQEQRIAVIGNSRFLTNGVIENYGNLALGLNLAHWLSHADALLQIEQPVAQADMLQVHLPTALIIQYGYPGLAGLLLLITMTGYYRRIRRSNKIAVELLHPKV